MKRVALLLLVLLAGEALAGAAARSSSGSLSWTADRTAVDAVQCAAVAAAAINSGPFIARTTCADNAAGIIYGDMLMPPTYGGTPIAFTVEAYTDAADPAGVLGFDCSCQIRGQSDLPSSTWGTAVNVDVDYAPADLVTHDLARATSSGALCNIAATIAGAQHLFWRCAIDATASTATPLSATAGSSDYFVTSIRLDF